MVGTNADEWNLFGLANPGPADDAGHRPAPRPDWACDGAERRSPPTARPRPDADDRRELWSAIMTDQVFRDPGHPPARDPGRRSDPTTPSPTGSPGPPPTFDGRLGLVSRPGDPLRVRHHGTGAAPTCCWDPTPRRRCRGPCRTPGSPSPADGHPDPDPDGLGGWPAYDPDRRATMEFGDRIGAVDDPGGRRAAGCGTASPEHRDAPRPPPHRRRRAAERRARQRHLPGRRPGRRLRARGAQLPLRAAPRPRGRGGPGAGRAGRGRARGVPHRPAASSAARPSPRTSTCPRTDDLDQDRRHPDHLRARPQHHLPGLRPGPGRGARRATTSSSGSTPSTTAATPTAGPSSWPPSRPWPTWPPGPGSRDGTASASDARSQDLGKADIIRLGTGLGVDYAATTSCYDPDEQRPGLRALRLVPPAGRRLPPGRRRRPDPLRLTRYA